MESYSEFPFPHLYPTGLYFLLVVCPVSHLKFIYLKLVFVQADRYRSNFILWQVDIQFPKPNLLKMLSFFPAYALDNFVKRGLEDR